MVVLYCVFSETLLYIKVLILLMTFEPQWFYCCVDRVYTFFTWKCSNVQRLWSHVTLTSGVCCDLSGTR